MHGVSTVSQKSNLGVKTVGDGGGGYDHKERGW